MSTIKQCWQCSVIYFDVYDEDICPDCAFQNERYEKEVEA